MYLLVKNVHILTVLISVVLLTFRFVLMLRDSGKKHHRFLNVFPHVNDSVLLLSGVYLIYLTGSLPFTSSAPWLTEKLMCVVAYIALGLYALKFGKTKWLRTFAFLGALGWIFMAGHISMTKVPTFM
ncbi:SirB2 family protein [Vibrio salinus]|uniref:SirB2 family protein n=1 Tax=Vibrio salinus TaxID=2899784 RepID=UPI001E56349B|nr:SirB2 family protein [Vibrio salinus]MCE0494461.1 SirB2 family protein [Vibrio salinus]